MSPHRSKRNFRRHKNHYTVLVHNVARDANIRALDGGAWLLYTAVLRTVMDPIALLVAAAFAEARSELRKFLGDRAERERVDELFDKVVLYLVGKVPSADLQLLESVEKGEFGQVGFAMNDLPNDLEGKELRASVESAIRSADPFGKHQSTIRNLVEATYEGVLRALSRPSTSGQALRQGSSSVASKRNDFTMRRGRTPRS